MSSNTGTSASATTAGRWSASGSMSPSGCTRWRMPDGRRFIFGRALQGQRTLWSAAADGSDPRQLTSEGTATWPAVSADGRVLVFFGDRGADSGIWRSDIDGANPRLVAKVADASYVAFAPDQHSVYFTSTMRGAPATYRLSVDGGARAHDAGGHGCADRQAGARVPRLHAGERQRVGRLDAGRQGGHLQHRRA